MARAIHPFPARMASDIALDAMRETTRPLTILDPMCGSGTVLAKGRQRGHSMLGFDLDPLAVLMSRVATSSVDVDALSSMAAECVGRARRSSAKVAPWKDSATEPFARYWFAPTQYTQLLRLSRQLQMLKPGPEREALEIAMSRTIVTKTPQASLAADTAHSRPHRVATESTYDVFEGFLRSARLLGRQLTDVKGFEPAKVERRDARDASSYGEGSVDLVITSPPYLNAIDYLRGHRLALIWLGYSVSELRRLRATAIGSEAKLHESENAPRHLDSIQDLLQAVGNPEALPTELLARYARDMDLLAANLQSCLVPGGRAIFVVADSVLRGNVIPTGQIIIRRLESAGLEWVSTTTREIPSGSRYLPVNNAGEMLGKRMKHEYVITAKKVAA